MERLPRKWARRAIACVVIGVIIFAYAIYLDDSAYGLVGLLYLLAGLLMKHKFLRCPLCGQGGAAVPQWKKAGKHQCKKCKTLLQYDDEV